MRPPDRDALRAALAGFIDRGVDAPRDDDSFERLSLALFAYQFAHNTPYRAYCERRGATARITSGCTE